MYIYINLYIYIYSYRYISAFQGRARKKPDTMSEIEAERDLMN